MPRRRFSVVGQRAFPTTVLAIQLTLERHLLECRSHRHLLGGGELHALISFAIDSVSHDGCRDCDSCLLFDVLNARRLVDEFPTVKS